MELRTARLCLDCEEVHAEQKCPTCASESFAYLTRWVPVADRPQVKRTAPTPAAPETATTPGLGLRWARRGVVGVALVAISQWLWRNSRPVEWGEAGSGKDDEKAE
jgi:hypothetical protein